MKYSKDDKYVIFKMKITIVNEFKYCYNRSDTLGLALFIEPDTTLEFDSLKEACEIGIDRQLIDNLSKSKFLDLFNEALVELFAENIIKFVSDKILMMTESGEEMFIDKNILYSSIPQK